MQYIIFGTGDYYERYKKWFDKKDIAALIDNSPAKQNTFIDGLEVLAPEEGIQRNYDVIVILSFYVKEMREQLLCLGVDADKIYHFYDLHRLFQEKAHYYPVQYYGQAKAVAEADRTSRKKILLLSQDLTLGGPAIALFHAAVILKKHGYDVVYASMLDGSLRDKLMQCGIPVIVDVNLQIAKMNEVEWVRNFSLIFCNTINYFVFLSKRYKGIPAIWWLHDSAFFYSGVNHKVMRQINQNDLTVVSVGPVPEKAFHGVLPEVAVGKLLYGTEDCYFGKTYCQDKEKIIFVTIGYIEERKGQDLLVEAINKLPLSLINYAEFWLVGQSSSLMAQRLKSELKNIPQIIMKGTVDREGINNILNEADVLICPSREDPMPTVAAEAMMHEVMCLVSDITGTAEYICDGKDGLIFESENTDALSRKIAWCIQNRQILQDMGKRAREIYKKQFSMQVFEKNLIDLISNAITYEEGKNRNV